MDIQPFFSESVWAKGSCKKEIGEIYIIIQFMVNIFTSYICTSYIFSLPLSFSFFLSLSLTLSRAGNRHSLRLQPTTAPSNRSLQCMKDMTTAQKNFATGTSQGCACPTMQHIYRGHWVWNQQCLRGGTWGAERQWWILRPVWQADRTVSIAMTGPCFCYAAGNEEHVDLQHSLSWRATCWATWHLSMAGPQPVMSMKHTQLSVCPKASVW